MLFYYYRMKGKRFFYKLALSTLVAVYILIMVGGVVRSTGSGMGCPDWPRCFGNWVPPTSVDQLPADYKEVYSDYRHKKNVRFAKYLSALGMSETADQILHDQSIREENDFNPVKTWIEYVNRIVGVVIGFLIFLVFIVSVTFWKTRRSWTWLAFATFILVGFQGWIGSVVVSTNLTPWTITIHMFLALVIVALLIVLVYQAGEGRSLEAASGLRVWLLACSVLLLTQVFLGTQVREGLDRVAAALITRSAWIESIGVPFIVHRSFSWLVLAVHVVFIMKLRKTVSGNRFALSLILLILGTVLSGVGMAWFAVPAFLQPVHLTLATVTAGVEFFLWLKLVPHAKHALQVNV